MIAFILAFVFRAYVVEAFVIPTGSMAPTLLGRHFRVVCSQCGYRFATDTPEQQGTPALQRASVVVCPMCHFPNFLTRGTRVSSGDRILVHKYIYSFSDPKRWDVIVFKNPQETNPDGSPGPTTNYIKRLVGLPHERLWIIEGNIYVQSGDGPWRIARKSERPKVQRAVWQPIYHSRFMPLDKGHSSPGRAQYSWRYPWVAVQPRHWEPYGRGGMRYNGRHQGVLQFHFPQAMKDGPGLYEYNQLRRPLLAHEPVEDVRISATVEPEQSSLAFAISTTTRADARDGRSLKLVGRIDRGEASLVLLDPQTNQVIERCGKAKVSPFVPGIANTIELWYVDQEASLWIDGRRVLMHLFELPIEIIKSRRGPDPFPHIAIECSGSPVKLHQLEVDRDLYYSGMNHNGTPARGAWSKSEGGYRADPVELAADQFFCCGDNSPLSHDGRYWHNIDPWIQSRLFQGIADPQRSYGIVPRQMVMGKAFFVYFPTPLRFGKNSLSLIPNLGDMRFIY